MIGQTERLHELNKLARFGQSASQHSPIFSITSGKGGTGKSFIVSI